MDCRGTKTSPRPSTPTLSDLLLDGFVANFTDGYAAGLPILRRAVSAARRDASQEEQQFLWLAGIAALHIWDDDTWDEFRSATSSLAVRQARWLSCR